MEEQEQRSECAEPPGQLNVGITFNLKKNIITEPRDAEAEFDDYGTILAIRQALEEAGHKVELYPADAGLPECLAKKRPDIVFNIAEGMYGRGREAQVPAILNFFSIPFTGSDETTMCLSMDKALAKKLLSSYRILTPKYRLFRMDEPLSLRGIHYPVIVKPNTEGSGKGISGLSVARDAGTLRRALEETIRAYKQDMLVEEFVRGREFTVGILGNGARTRVFPPMEIIFRDEESGFYSYEVKQHFKDHVDYKCPPDVDDATRQKIMETAAKIYDILACKDCARIDFRMDRQGRIFFIEINTLPGLAPGYSDFPMLAQYCGVGYGELIRGILNAALERYGMPLSR